MKAFKALEGVELVEVCGEYMLVATRDARDLCPFVTQINKPAADYWKLLDGPFTTKTLCEKAMTAFGTDERNTLLAVLAFVTKLQKSGYLVPEDIG